jgi:hypothetical protein
MRKIFATTCVLSVAGLLMAGTQVIDGVGITSANWGAALATQDTKTQFGDNENELNQMFVDADSSNIFIGLSGNLSDQNALHVYIDTDPSDLNPGGSLSSDDGSCTQLSRAVVEAMMGNTLFDAGFDPDYAISATVGKFPGQSDTQLVYACDMLALDGSFANEVLGIGAVGTGNGLLTGAQGVEIAMDNSNAAGVVGFDPNDPLTDPNAPATANTGIEIAIPRSLIGVTGAQDIRVFAFITNDATGGGPGNVCPDPNDPNGPMIPQTPGPCNRYGFASNQALPGLAGNGNLASFTPGGCNTIDFVGPQGPGDQFVTVSIPAP